MNNASISQPFVKYCPSRFGKIALIWLPDKDLPKIFQIVIPAPETAAERTVEHSYSRHRQTSCAEIDSLAERMEAYLCGSNISFSLDLVRLNRCSAFQQQVLRAEHAIPRGRVSSYGRIARRIGRPGGARAVGSALANNPFPIIIPCHRAVRSDGHLGGFQGGLAMKRALLEMEAIQFTDKDHVDSGHFYY